MEESSQLHKTDEVRPPNSLTPRNLRNLETLTASSSRHDKSIEEKKLMLDDRNTQSPIKAAKMNRKNDDIDAEEKSWWLKLPYALVSNFHFMSHALKCNKLAILRNPLYCSCIVSI